MDNATLWQRVRSLINRISINVHTPVLIVGIVGYIYIPIIIFVSGFAKLYWAIPTLIIIGISLALLLKDIIAKEKEKEPHVRINVLTLILVIGIMITLCVLLGWGGFYPQAGDWYKHNAVLRDLSFNSWPVYYELKDRCMLTYYLGQYLLPALVGKLAQSFEVANMCMMIWGIIGLLFVYLLLIRIVRADTFGKQLVTLFILFFFCGALVLTQTVLSGIFGDFMYSLGSNHWVLVKSIMLQYRSNMVMLRWVFPQCVVPWLVCMIFLIYRKECRHYVTFILPVILYGSFSFAALIVMALVEAIYQLVKKQIRIKELFSFENVGLALSLGGILFFYFLGNLQVDKPVSSSFRWQTYSGKNIIVYIIFCIFMFGIYAFCVFKEKKHDIQWYVCVGILLILPWCRMGLCNDIVMSGSIPSQFILMIFCIQLLFNKDDAYADDLPTCRFLWIRKTLVVVIMIIGLWYPFLEIRENVRLNWPGSELADGYYTMEWFTDREDTNVTEDLRYNYYTYDLEGKIFYEYIAAKKDAK